MSNLLKKSVIAASISSALVISTASAKTIDLPTVISKYASHSEKVNMGSVAEQLPTSHLIVLNASSAAELLAAGNFKKGDLAASASKISLLQEAVIAKLNNFDFDATVIAKTKILAPGLIVRANQSALEKIAKDTRVKMVLPIFDNELHIEDSSDYIKATPVRTAGLANGATQKVAVLDTGIDYTHKIFGGAGTVEAYEEAQSDPTMVAWPQGQVSGGYDFMRDDVDPIENDEDFPGSDSGKTGHGTSVSHSVTGIAPEVELYVYSVCGGGCPGAAIIAALEAAMDPNGDGDISDRVDVINMSLGAEFGNTYTGSGAQYLIQKAGDLGVNMVISAGNDGDNPFRVSWPSTTPNALSVGAMKHPTIKEWASVGNLDGETYTLQAASFGPQGAYEESFEIGEVIYPDTNQNGCEAFAEGTDFTDKVVLIDRGTCDFTDKVLNAQAKGAKYVLIANNINDGKNAPMGGSSDEVTILSAGITFALGAIIKQGIVDASTQTILIKNTQYNVAGAVADFSSRGPSVDGLLKPEITAPGVDIQVADTGTQDKVAGATGTSFSGPMTAGAVALVRETLPERNAHEIKATLMNTADLNVTVEPVSINPDSALAPISLIGAGLVNVEKAVASPVAAWVYQEDFDTNQGALSFGFDVLAETTSYTKTVNLKNFSNTEKTYNLRTQARFENDETSGAISWEMPESVTVAPGQTIGFDVTLTIDPSKLHEWALVNPLNADMLPLRSPALTMAEFDGAVIFDDPSTDGDHDLHLVYHVLPKAYSGMKMSYALVNGKAEVVVKNTGFNDITPMASQMVKMEEVIIDENKQFQVIGSTINAYNNEFCSSGLALSASIVLRDDIFHLRQPGGYGLEFDIDNDGTYDFALAQYSDVGISAEVPGRVRGLSGEIVDGQTQWAWIETLLHTSGNHTVSFFVCSQRVGLTADHLSQPIGIKASVGFGDRLGIFDEVDTLVGSTVFAAPQASFTDMEGNPVEKLAPGEQAIVVADSDMVVSSMDDFSMLTEIPSEALNNEMPFPVPMLNDVELSVDENTATDTVIGTLAVEEQELGLDIVEYYMSSTSHAGFKVSKSGEVMVANKDLLDYELNNNTAILEVVAIDKMTQVSEPATVTITVNNLIDTEAERPAPEPEQKKKSSGSFAWLTLLALPFAAFRRRKQK